MKIMLKDIEKFHEMLLRKGFTKRELGRQAGISEVYAQQIANGDRNPGAKVAKRICLSLQVEFDEIFLLKLLAKASMRASKITKIVQLGNKKLINRRR